MQEKVTGFFQVGQHFLTCFYKRLALGIDFIAFKIRHQTRSIDPMTDKYYNIYILVILSNTSDLLYIYILPSVTEKIISKLHNITKLKII